MPTYHIMRNCPSSDESRLRITGPRRMHFPSPREEDASHFPPAGLTPPHLLRSSDQTALEWARCRTTEPSTIDVRSFQSA
eukprot:2780272-Pyramimonas_sp.AAC.1